MFTPHSFGISLVMMVTASICWGSWANTFKGVKRYRFELFYWDYAIGIFLLALALAFTMGSTDNGPASFINNVKSADAGNIGWVLLAGVIFNLANLLLMAGIDLVGLATAFPVSIGIALVVGVVLSYVQEHRGNLNMLTAGILCAVAAVILDGKAYGELKTGKSTTQKGLFICVVAGLLMGLWAPFSTRALTHGNTLGPYSVSVFLFTGVSISYAIGQSAPMVAALWGIFAWKEFAGANTRAKAYLTLMFVFYILAILLVARANTAS
jgi:glucose uptake protein